MVDTSPSGLVLGKDGSLYGSADVSGSGNQCGNVFQLSPAAGRWKETVLFQKFFVYNGCQPDAGVVLGEDGALYGMTVLGGTISKSECNGNGCGTVFKLTRPISSGASWTQTVLFDFDAETGWEPFGGLAIGPGAELYGTTFFGGTAGAGTVFQLQPPDRPGGAWTHTVLYNFTYANGDGAEPDAAVVIGPNGALYGVTQNGGVDGLGTVFELKPPASPGAAWSETIIHSFSGGSDGAEPEAGLTAVEGPDGRFALYGTTYFGGTGPCAATGAPAGCGTVFVLTASSADATWSETVLHSFTNADGAKPNGPLLLEPGTQLYGTTLLGGSGACNSYLGQGCGTVFKLTR